MSERNPDLEQFIKEVDEWAAARERSDAADFFESHGIIDISKRRALLFDSLNVEEKEYLDIVEKETHTFSRQIQELPEVQRLLQLPQLGGKLNPEHLAGEPLVVRPAFHTRFEHSELLAELAKFAGVRLRLSVQEIKTIMAAAWFHDIGHPAFSHGADELLKEMGEVPHEKRTVEKIHGPNIAPLLQAHDVVPEAVIDSIEERGALGTLQSVLDTLSYLIVDSEMMQHPFYTDAGAHVIATIEGIHENKLVVNDPNVWQEVLEFRAEHMKDTIYHPLNKMVDESLRQLLRIALDKGYITPEDLKNGTDSRLRFKLQSLVQHDPGAALMAGREDNTSPLESYRELFAMSIGLPDMNKWTKEQFELGETDPKDVRKKVEQRIALEPQKVQKQTLVLAPYNYTKKKLHVLTQDQEGYKEHALQARNVTLRPEDKSFVVLLPNFLTLSA